MTAELVASLTEDEAADLVECEETIERELRSFVDCGMALAKVRDGRLYRRTHLNFEAYCHERWNLSRPHAYRMIEASETVRALSPMGDIPTPTSERQARELAGLPTETAAEVMAEAAESGKLTAASIRDARERIAPRVEPEPEPTPEAAQKLADFLDADPDLRRRDQARKFRQALNHSWALQEWEPEFVASILDDDDVVTIDHLILNLTSFRDQVQAARRTPLAIVKEMKR